MLRLKRKLMAIVTISAMLASLLGTGGITAAAAENNPPLPPTGLRVELLSEAFGIGPSNPALSWEVNDNDSNEIQTAYQVLVASTKEKIDANNADVYDSGKVLSDESTYVKLENLSLAQNSLYYWKVRTWDKADAPSQYSEPKCITTAVGSSWASTDSVWVSQQDIYQQNGWTNYAVEADIKVNEVALALTFRTQAPASYAIALQFRGDGTMSYLYRNGGAWAALANGTVTYPANAKIVVGTYSHVKVECIGTTYTTYINGVQVDKRTISTPAITSGTIGFRTGGSESGTAKNIEVYKIDAAGVKGDALYADNFAGGINSFSGGTVANGEIAIPRGGDYYMNALGVSPQNGNFAFLRNEFDIADKDAIEKAIVSVTAKSTTNIRQYVYSLFLNGESVGIGPARSNDSAKITFYNSYDVTNLLKTGKNAIGAVNYATSNKQFLLQMTVFYKDGTKQVLLNSGRDRALWKSLDGTAAFGETGSSIGTSYYTAASENLNANIYPFGWDMPGFDDSRWDAPMSKGQILSSGFKLAPNTSENVNRYLVDVAKVVNKGNGNYFIDLGKEVIGGFYLDIDSHVSQAITVRAGEQTSAPNTVRYAMLTGNNYQETWTLKQGPQVLQNFGMKAIRYVEILNSPVEIKAENCKAVSLRQAFDDNASSFNSSDDFMNTLYEFTKYSIKATNQDLYVDSQSRERGAYEGDVIINGLSAYGVEANYSLARFTNENLYTNATWPAEYKLFSVIAAYLDYIYSGNIDSLVSNYDVIKGKLFDSKFNTTINLVQRPTSAGSGTNAILVDWPDGERDGYAYSSAEYNTVFNAVHYWAYDCMAKIADAVGKTADAGYYTNRAALLKQGMIDRLFDKDKGIFRDGLTNTLAPINNYSQHANAFPLSCGIVDDASMAASIAKNIDARGLKTSVYGSFFVLAGLYRAEAGLEAYKIMTANQIRSWKHVINDLGATMATEAWDPTLKGNMTFSHPWGSAPGSQIPQGLFGINPTEPGFEKFDIKFQPGGLDYASIKVPTLKGAILASFDTSDVAYIIKSNVTIPANTSSNVSLPAKNAGHDIVIVDGIPVVAARNGDFLTVALGSGEHTLSVPAPFKLSVSIDDPTNLFVGKTGTLNINIENEDGPVATDDAVITYSSDAESIISVMEDGVLSFNSVGSALITVNVCFYNFEMMGQVIPELNITSSIRLETRLPLIKDVYLAVDKDEITANETAKAEMMAVLESGDEYVLENASYVSSDESIATVDNSGVITGVSGGKTATISAYTTQDMANLMPTLSDDKFDYTNIYSDDFSTAGKTFPSLSVNDGRLFVGRSQNANYSGGMEWTDYVIDADITIQSTAASLRFRATDSTNYYLWQFRTDETLKIHAFAPNLPSGYTLIDTVPLKCLNNTASNKIRIVVLGDTFTTYVNGQLVNVAKDSTHKKGSIGVRNGSGEEFYMDSIAVSSRKLVASKDIYVESTSKINGLDMVTGTVVAKNAANIAMNITGTDLAGQQIELKLVSGNETLANTIVNCTNDSFMAVLPIASAPDAGNYTVVASVVGTRSAKSADLTVVSNDDVFSATVEELNGKLAIKFNTAITAGTGFAVSVDGQKVSASIANGNYVCTDLEFDSVNAGAKIVISKVKLLPFPSYSFNFSVTK